MNDQFNDDDMTREKETKMNTWTMAISTLAGVNKVLDQAREELAVLLAEHNQNQMAPGASQLRAIIEAMLETKKVMEPELAQVARANRLPMPAERPANAVGGK